MPERTAGLKKWHNIETLRGLSLCDLQKLVLTCGDVLALRISHGSDQDAQLQILCGDEEEYTRAEVLLHQAVADDRLRQLIERQSAGEIVALVDRFIARATRG
jgi:hypothetical protein